MNFTTLTIGNVICKVNTVWMSAEFYRIQDYALTIGNGSSKDQPLHYPKV